MRTDIFLCHASEDKAIVDRYYDGLRYFDGINPWYDKKSNLAGQQIPEALKEAITGAPVFLLFWSKAACNKYIQEGPYEGLSNIRLEVNLALVGRNGSDERINASEQLLIVVRLDDTPFVPPLDVRLQFTRYIDGRNCYYENVKVSDIGTNLPGGRIDIPNHEREAVEWKEWRAVNEIVGRIRGVVPVYATEDVLAIGGKWYLQHVWIGGNSGSPENRNGTAYVESIDLKRGTENLTLIPALRYGGGTGFWIKIPKQVTQGWFVADISFGSGLASWSKVDLTNHREIRFNARAFVNGISVNISLCDTSHGECTNCGHRETTAQAIKLGYTWKPGGPYSLKLDDFDWSKNGTPKNSGAVQRSSVLQLVIGNVGMNWPDGNYTIEIKQVVVI